MYIFFINLGSKCDIFFSTQFNNNSNKKIVQPMWVGLGWVGLNFFFLITMVG